MLTPTELLALSAARMKSRRWLIQVLIGAGEATAMPFVSSAWERDAAAGFVEELFAAHHGEIYAYLIRMLRDPELAADLTQDAFPSWNGWSPRPAQSVRKRPPSKSSGTSWIASVSPRRPPRSPRTSRPTRSQACPSCPTPGGTTWSAT